MGPVLLCARLGGMAVSAHRTQTRSVSAYRRPECLLKSRMCERHLSGSERAWAATFGEHPVYSTTALVWRSLLRPSGFTGSPISLARGQQAAATQGASKLAHSKPRARDRACAKVYNIPIELYCRVSCSGSLEMDLCTACRLGVLVMEEL